MSNSVYLFLTLLIGFCFPVMASSNGILGRALGSPFIATLAVFQLGSALLLLIILFTKSGFPGIARISGIHWTVWLGACIVILNLLTFTIVPGKIGIANMVVLFTAGQLMAAVLAEHYGLLHFPVHKINWQRTAGIIFLVAGVVLVKKF